MTVLKNKALPSSPAAGDLGLGMGDELQQQLENEVMQRRKQAQKIAGADQGQGIYNPQRLSAAGQALGLGMS